MRVLLTHGYYLCDDPREQEIMKPYPPLGLLYLSAWLERYGVDNAVFDSTFSDRKTLEAYLLEHRPAIVAVYVNLMTKLEVIRLLRFLRAQERLRDSLIVLGGPDVTHNAAEYLAAGADLAVLGEGEQTLLELAQSPVGRAEQYAHVAGLAYLLPDGSLHKTAPREKIADLDQLPIPNRYKIDMQRYLDAWKKAHGHNALSISTQRGCPYTCRWCSTAVYGQSYRRRSPDHVADEIETLQKTYDFDLLWFVDDVFTISHRWMEGFREALQARGLQIRFECITRADRLNEEVLALLKACGCYRVWIGAESGSQRIIDAMDRRVEVGQVRSMIQAARAQGIETGTFIMLGYPGETEADIQETVRHLEESNPDLFTITVAYPIRGTGLYGQVEADIRADVPWDQRSDRDLDFPRTYSRRYYDYAVRWTVNRVLWHKARHAGKRPWMVLLKIVAARLGMTYLKWNKSVKQ